MTYFAIGESTGGAGERRLGPFDTPEEAEDAGKRETKDSNGGFVFKGVVDEANNQVVTDIRPVSTNSVVRNALSANRRVARNAVEPPFCNNYDVFLAIERGDNPLNDFIKFGVREENAEMSRGEVPRTRKDILEMKMEKLLSVAKRRVSNLTEGLNKLRSVK